MKKLSIAVLLVLSFILAIPSFALQARSPSVMPGLSFSGTTARCTVTVEGDYVTDQIELDVELWQGTTLIDSWSEENTDYIEFSATATAVKGKSYTLKAYATVNGRDLPVASITRTCP